MPEPNELTSIVQFARKLHGHIGPYLVIGLKMGAAAKKALNIPDPENTQLNAKVAVSLHPPFSCLPRWDTSINNLHSRKPKTPVQRLKSY